MCAKICTVFMYSFIHHIETESYHMAGSKTVSLNSRDMYMEAT